MTSATEKLRRLLDERGVEWFGSYDSDETSWNVGELTWVYGDDGNIAGLGVVQGDITPEQAIAATLGQGTLTAEQVRTAIFNGSSYASYDGAKYYADGISMQVIADELNAVLRG